MIELEDSNEPVRRNEARERWRAMQAAYADYIRATEVYENSRELTQDPAGPGHCELALLEDRRDAFARYLEARMEYLERRFDEGYPREPARVSGPTRVIGRLASFSRLVDPKWLLLVLAAGFLSVIVFSFIREQKHVRELDSARDQLLASLTDTRAGLQLLAKTLETRESTGPSAVRPVENTTPLPVPIPQGEARKPSGGIRWRHVPQQIAKTSNRTVAARNYFSLSRSSQFKRVGPIQVALKSVNMKQNSVDVSIVSEYGTVDVQHLRLNQPVRIRGSYRGEPMELVVDRITVNGLSGHLIAFRG